MVWKLAMREIVTHPLLGVGYGNNTFLKLHPEYAGTRQEDRSQRERVLEGVHSTFMMVAMGSGIPAVICLLWVLVRIVGVLFRSAIQTSDHERKSLLIGIALGVVGFAVRNLFDYMFAGSLAVLFWILVATGFIVAGTNSQSLPPTVTRLADPMLI
jgi:O-antigen ligase